MNYLFWGRRLLKLSDLMFDELPKVQRLLLIYLAVAAVSMLAFLMYEGRLPGTVLINYVKIGVPQLLLALGAGIVLAAGKVDVSTAGVATLCGMVFAQLVASPAHPMGFVPAVVLASLLGAVLGMVNGAVVAVRAAPALIVTWAVGSLALVAAALGGKLLKDAGWPGVSNSVSLIGLVPDDAFTLSLDSYLPRYGLVVLAVVGMIVVLRLGRLARVVGSSENSAASQGYRVNAVLVVLYGVSGACSAIAGCLHAIETNAANTGAFQGQEMAAIAIAVLGGTVMSGGYFSILGIFVSASAWSLGTQFLASRNMNAGLGDSWAQTAIFSAILMLAAAVLGRRMSGQTRSIIVDDTRS